MYGSDGTFTTQKSQTLLIDKKKPLRQEMAPQFLDIRMIFLLEDSCVFGMKENIFLENKWSFIYFWLINK